MPEMNYELAPRQGMTASQRKAELDNARFVAVRNLAYMIYRRPDNQPLMTYQETLDDRERVKNVIIQHEIAAGLLVNDLGAPGAVAPPAQVPAPQMMAPAAPQMAPPAPAQPQQMAPPQPGNGVYAQPTMAPPAVASPAQAAAAAVPGTAEQPPQAGRRRRSAAGGAPPPPPPAAGPVPSPAVPGAAPAPAPAQMAFPATQPPPQPVAAAAPQPAYQPSAPAPVASGPAPVFDLTPVFERIDAVGQQTNELEVQLKDLRALCLQVLAAQHHFYATNPDTRQHLVNDKVNDLDGFRRYLSKFTGNPT